MKQMGKARGKCIDAWLLTLVMLLSLIVVPAGKVEAATDPVEVAVLNAEAVSITGVTYGNNTGFGEVAITNSGGGHAAPVRATFKSETNSNFGLITGFLQYILAGQTEYITVSPKNNLAAGRYNDVLIVSYFDGREMQKLSVPVSLTVDKREITVKADNQTKTFGENNPELTYSVTSGSIVKRDSNSLDITCSTTATATSEVGSYDISVKAGDNANYDIICTKGTLTIEKKPIASIIFPTASDIEEEQTLADSALSGGDPSYGDFAWEDATIKPLRGAQEENVVLTLSDTAKKKLFL